MANKINAKLVSGFLPARDDNSNKGSFGKVLNISGSDSYSGAAFLSSKASLKVGAGATAAGITEDKSASISDVGASAATKSVSYTGDAGTFTYGTQSQKFSASAAHGRCNSDFPGIQYRFRGNNSGCCRCFTV